MGSDRVRPFHCGSQFGDWTEGNCASCSKSIDRLGPDAQWSDMLEADRCPIEYAVSYSYMDDGTVSLSIAERMGAIGNECAYGWPCPEHDPPFANVIDGRVVPRN